MNSNTKIKYNCDQCGKPAEKRKDHFKEGCKNFCCLSCTALYKGEIEYNKYINLWLNGKINGSQNNIERISNHVVRWIKETKQEKCEKCGWNKINKTSGKIPLALHHKDGNCRNNIKENLELLCPNCHSLTSSYGSLNIGNGRKSRKK